MKLESLIPTHLSKQTELTGILMWFHHGRNPVCCHVVHTKSELLMLACGLCKSWTYTVIILVQAKWTYGKSCDLSYIWTQFCDVSLARIELVSWSKLGLNSQNWYVWTHIICIWSNLGLSSKYRHWYIVQASFKTVPTFGPSNLQYIFSVKKSCEFDGLTSPSL